MTKNFVPKESSLTPEEDAWFEALAEREFDRLSAPPLSNDSAIWRLLPLAHPSTRRRLLMLILAKCANCGCAPPPQLVDAIGRELDVSKSPRGRVADLSKLKDAARFHARNPSSSLEEIAAAVGGKKTTIRSFMGRPEFGSSGFLVGRFG
jgi:hypothetical protein